MGVRGCSTRYEFLHVVIARGGFYWECIQSKLHSTSQVIKIQIKQTLLTANQGNVGTLWDQTQRKGTLGLSS